MRSVEVMLLLHALNFAFAKIPIGGHTMCACVAASVVGVRVSISLRSIIEAIFPFEVVFVGILGLILMDILYGMIKFIPVKDERTGKTKRWAIGTCNVCNVFLSLVNICFRIKHTQTTGTWLHMPASHRPSASRSRAS